MRLGVDPKVDYAFKWLYGQPTRSHLLVSLLNALLRLPDGRKIENLLILNPYNEKAKLDDKLSILDIKAEDNQKRLYDIEMQLQLAPNTPERIIYYWARLYSEQLTEADPYADLRRTISILLIDQPVFPDVEDYHLHFELRDKNHSVRLSDALSIHVVQLPHFQLTADELKTQEERWLYFLRHASQLDMQAIPEQLEQPEIQEAMTQLRQMTLNDEERERYEARMKTLQYQATWARGIEKAQEERDAAIEERDSVKADLRSFHEKLREVTNIHNHQKQQGVETSSAEELMAKSLGELKTMAAQLEKQSQAGDQSAPT